MLSPFSPLPNYILGTGLTFVGLLGFIKPLAVYDAFGIQRPLSAQADPFSYAKAGRDLATGLLFVALETYQEGSGNEDAVTMLWATTALVGLVDWWVVRSMGGKELRSKSYVHLGSGALCALFAGWRLMY
ncbi:hypothetical protein CkaCkLH20_07141 [Colletotrichum karsti]|uniref:Uncharacterized protein n=1 Tax=Colletotrichum karsti TaxID=1095194 RepID=A0A9P6I5B2_9PEZI|nr:uncharacterized protein CkaCkLH20_07141 [Colletotrichum karsti]KAF9875321.1 hypothetical protein CkaCkLH20_07141 [Colletotrichum karsti]